MVTGGTGLLGSHLLVELCKTEAPIRVLVRDKKSILKARKTFAYYIKDPDSYINRIEWVEGDIRDVLLLEQMLENVSRVYHCAGFVSFDPGNKKRVLEVNSKGTANIVNATLNKRNIRFCHVSSIASLGRDKKGGFTDESDSWKQSSKSSVYSISKFEAEREVWRGVEEGLDAVIVNPSVILGPGNWKHGSSRLFQTVWNGLKYYSVGMNGFVDVRDVAGVMIQLMDSSISAERFVVSSENIAYRQLFDWMAEELGKEKPKYKIAPYFSGLIWRAEKIRSTITGKKPVVTRETATTANNEYRFSNEKIKSALDHQFIPVRESVRDTCRLFLSDKQST